MLSFFHALIYTPIYNVLIFFVDLVPHGDMGLALICASFVVRLVILPLSISAVRTQRAMRAIEPEMKEIKAKYKNDMEQQAKEQMALYKKYNIKPFASVLTMFIQLPILISLYLVIRHESLTVVNTALLYPFIHVPAAISPLFLGIVAISKPNLILAILVAITQFLQAYFAIPIPKKSENTSESMQEEFGRTMAMQARFVLPIIMGIVGYSSGAIALYFITSNIVMLIQELLVRTTVKPIVKTA